jgi:hypothetical protein
VVWQPASHTKHAAATKPRPTLIRIDPLRNGAKLPTGG